MNVSIIISTYNWHTALDILLDNLLRQTIKRNDVEIIVADDGSGSETLNVIKKYQSQGMQIKHVWHEDNGFRKAIILNRAVAHSTGDYLVFLDGDCIMFPDFIEEHIRIQERGYFVAGDRVLLSNKFTKQLLDNPLIMNNIIKWRLFNWIFAKLVKKVNKIFVRIKLSNDRWRYIRGTHWRYPKGCNFAVYRDAFFAVNGFDEGFVGWGHEDADLFVRLLHSGLRIKNGRFAITILHLWHKASLRNDEQSNWDKLMSRVEDKNFIQAKLGINSKYLE